MTSGEIELHFLYFIVVNGGSLPLVIRPGGGVCWCASWLACVIRNTNIGGKTTHTAAYDGASVSFRALFATPTWAKEFETGTLARRGISWGEKLIIIF